MLRNHSLKGKKKGSYCFSGGFITFLFICLFLVYILFPVLFSSGKNQLLSQQCVGNSSRT